MWLCYRPGNISSLIIHLSYMIDLNFKICLISFTYKVYEIEHLDEISTSESLEWRIGTGKGNYKWASGCIFIPKFDIETIAMGNSANCGDFCFADKRCTHFNYLKNRCYLKTIVDSDSKASVYNNPDAICGFMVERVYFITLHSSFYKVNRLYIIKIKYLEIDEEMAEQQ